jgi:antitoxin PrlF
MPVFASRMTSKGQTTVPKEIREQLKLRPGDKVLWYLEDGRVVFRAKNRSIREMAGMLHRPGQRPVSLEEMDEAIAQAAGERAMAGLKPRR